MPGPVSDSYDPEFSTGSNAQDVADAIVEVRLRIDKKLGPKLNNIVAVAQGKDGKKFDMKLSEKELRVIRFCLNRSAEMI
jgi:hypothetical protein